MNKVDQNSIIHQILTDLGYKRNTTAINPPVNEYYGHDYNMFWVGPNETRKEEMTISSYENGSIILHMTPYNAEPTVVVTVKLVEPDSIQKITDYIKHGPPTPSQVCDVAAAGA